MRALSLFLFITLCVYASSMRKSNVLTWDVYGYSFYLSGLINNNSILQPKHLDSIDAIYAPCGEVKGYGRFDVPNSNNQVYKYTIGTAYFYAPFYFSAHLYTKYINTKYPADGYSPPYGRFLMIGWLIWGLLGLWTLGKFLLRYFDSKIVIAALSIIAFTTNYWAYTSSIIGYNHIPLFFLAALGLIFADNWVKKGKAKDFYGLSFCMALSVIVRPSEVTLLAIIPCILLGVKHYQNAILPFLKKRIYQLFIGIGIAIFIALPQLIYWYMATGNILPSAYQGESFDFSNPKIWQGLFSYRKGWFVYAPLMILACFGFLPFFKRKKDMALALSTYLFINLYVIFSWWCWTYGGSLGARSMIQSMVFWAIPLCFCLNVIWHFISSLNHFFGKGSMALCFSIFLCFAYIQSLQIMQYRNGFLHWENMTKRAYWLLFLERDLTPELHSTLFEEEYNKDQPY